MASHHDYEHPHDETYFMDQMFMIALGGAFGVICLSMYFVKQTMMQRLLGTQFHPFLLASGIALTLIAVVRAWILWTEAGAAPTGAKELDGNTEQGQEQECQHDHGACDHEHGHSHSDHGHSHSHGDHGHSHSHGGEEHHHAHAPAEIAGSRAFGQTPQSPAVASHSHAHSHSHGHGDDHADHDHGWAPWRYALLLAPIMLFLLGLPSKGPSTSAVPPVTVNTPEEAAFGAAIAATAHDGPSALGAYLHRVMHDAEQADVYPTDVKMLESWAAAPSERERWKGKVVRLTGQVLPQSPRSFNIVRFRVSCCAADAIGVPVPVLVKEPLESPPPRDSWVEVTGRVEFRPVQGKMMAIVIVANPRQIQPRPPDQNPYIQ